jgi:hypothetical protein
VADNHWAGLHVIQQQAFMQKFREEMQAKYRLLFFSTDIGVEVLADILQMCHFTIETVAQDPVQNAVKNVGEAILRNCGIYKDGHENMVEFLRAVQAIKPEP